MSDLDDLARDLSRAADELPEQVEKVVSHGALNVKNDWRKNARRDDSPHAKFYDQAITYDLNREGAATTAEIGPQDQGPGERKQGFLGRVLEYGAANTQPHLSGNRATDEEEPRFEQAMADLGDGLL